MNFLLAVILAVSVNLNPLKAIDLSQWNGSPAPILAREHPAAVFLRGSYGPFRDSQYAAGAAAAAKLGIPEYAYLFLRPSAAGATPEQQVDAFLAITASTARGFVVDWEGDTYFTPNVGLGSNLAGSDRPSVLVAARASLGDLTRAVARFHAKGFRVGVYASEFAPFPHVGQDWNWVANYSRAPTTVRADVWQYNGTGLDRDYIYSSLTALDAKAAPVVDTTLRYITANYYDCSSLPSVHVRHGTPIRDLTGKAWGTVAADTNLCAAGLASGRSGEFVVLINTSRYSPKGASWRVWQIVQGVLN